MSRYDLSEPKHGKLFRYGVVAAAAFAISGSLYAENKPRGDASPNPSTLVTHVSSRMIQQTITADAKKLQAIERHTPTAKSLVDEGCKNPPLYFVGGIKGLANQETYIEAKNGKGGYVFSVNSELSKKGGPTSDVRSIEISRILFASHCKLAGSENDISLSGNVGSLYGIGTKLDGGTLFADAYSLSSTKLNSASAVIFAPHPIKGQYALTPQVFDAYNSVINQAFIAAAQREDIPKDVVDGLPNVGAGPVTKQAVEPTSSV